MAVCFDPVFRSSGVEHGPYVLGPLLPGRDGIARYAIGSAGATAVKEEESAKGGKPLQELGGFGYVPKVVDVASESVAVQKVNRAVTDDLVSDVGGAHSNVSGRRNFHTGGQFDSLATGIAGSGS
jgi:hypothetical protein